MTISQQRLKEIAAIPDDKIDTSDIPELDDDFWKDARLVIPESGKLSGEGVVSTHRTLATPGDKKLIHLCIEKDVLEWFSQFGDDYQIRMNAVLRDYVEAHR